MPLSLTVADLMGLDNLPKLTKPKEIYNFFVSTQVRVYGVSIDLPYYAFLRNIKLLLKDFLPEEILVGIILASQYSEYPFSTALVKEVLQERHKKFEQSGLDNFTILLKRTLNSMED